MTTSRKFAGFAKSAMSGSGEIPSFRMKEIPDGGMCLSSFLVISEESDSRVVLMGHLNPKAPWDHIGALDESRIQAHSKGWMLPSSHLIVHESPQEAATRILKEQLGIDDRWSHSRIPKLFLKFLRPKDFRTCLNIGISNSYFVERSQVEGESRRATPGRI